MTALGLILLQISGSALLETLIILIVAAVFVTGWLETEWSGVEIGGQTEAEWGARRCAILPRSAARASLIP